MSLNWNVEKIKDYKNVCWIDGEDEGEAGDDRRMNPVTETLIFGTMGVGLGNITARNVDEFAARFRILERIHGAFLYKPDGKGGTKDWLVSDEDFIMHIGLACNVSDESRSAWARRIFVNKQSSETEAFARSFRHNREKVAA
jgi:hypothetical protein